MVNDKQWQDNSDGWVTAMNKSKEKKRAKKMTMINMRTCLKKKGMMLWRSLVLKKDINF